MDILKLVDSEELYMSLVRSSFKDMNGKEVVPLEAVKNTIDAFRYKKVLKTPTELIFEDTFSKGEFIVDCVFEIAVSLSYAKKEDITDNFSKILERYKSNLALTDEQWSVVGKLMDCCCDLCKKN